MAPISHYCRKVSILQKVQKILPFSKKANKRREATKAVTDCPYILMILEKSRHKWLEAIYNKSLAHSENIKIIKCYNGTLKLSAI